MLYEQDFLKGRKRREYMRTLVVMRGAPGCGKSTFVQENRLAPYALCADSIRELFESPVMDDEHGVMQLSQKNDKRVWQLLFQLLEERMQRGELCIVDATHSRPKDFSKYKDLMEKYRYRAYCVDFTDIPIDVCKQRNLMRPEYKRVPENVIDVMYARFANFPVPNYFKVISHDDHDALNDVVHEYKPTDANAYSKVVVFGDIHGCYEPMKEYFESHPFDRDALYVFTGDYVDRGIQNDKVVSWLLEHYQERNVVLLQGNHERWLIEYANGEYDEEIRNGGRDRCKSSMFFEHTIPQLSQFRKKDLRELCRRFRAVAYLSFDGRRYFISHAGVGFMPESIVKVKAETFIRGNGKYEDAVDERFERHETERNPDLYQIHAHRNVNCIPIHPFEHSFNLCDRVEFGGGMRILEITKD